MKGNNLSPAVGVKLAGKLDAFLEGFEERAWPEAPANDEAADPVGDVNQVVDNFHVGRCFEKNRRVEMSACKHNAPLPNRRVEGAFLNVTNALTPNGEGKTRQNALFIHSVPIWVSNFSTNDGSRLPDSATNTVGRA